MLLVENVVQAEDLKQQLAKARNEGITVRGIVVINPGNPTGQLLSKENVEAIIRLCVEENLVLMADEVYQTNVYRDGKTFTSFRKVRIASISTVLIQWTYA